MTLKKNRWLLLIYPLFIVLAGIGYLVGDNQIWSKITPPKTLNDHFATDVTYIDLPRLNVTMTRPNSKYSHLRLDLSLEIERKHDLEIQGFKPRLLDDLNTYISEQDFNDINKPRIQRYFRSDLLVEINRVTYPVPVMDVIFRQMVFM